MAQLTSVEHVSPYCVKLVMDDPLRNDSELRDTANYVVQGANVVDIDVEYSQRQEYNPSGPIFGGSPRAVYLILDAIPSAGDAGFTVSGHVNIVDFEGFSLTGSEVLSLTVIQSRSITYWDSSGVRTEHTFNELSKIGRARFTDKQPINYSTAHMIGKLNELMSGGLTGKIAVDIDGPLEPEYVNTFSEGAFANPIDPLPGIGETITFEEGAPPYHVDKLWGPSNGTNDLFRSSIPFHPHSCVLIVAEKSAKTTDPDIVDTDRWYAPNSGIDRQIIFRTAPAEGATVLAVYLPRKSLLRIGNEIIAYDECDLSTGSVVIYGRAQISSELQVHSSGDTALDVWAASFVERVEYNALAFGASGRALEYIALDEGSPRSDNTILSDTQLRRMIFHTSITMRGTPSTAREGIRYIYPNFWQNMIVGEDPRWPGCVVIWYSEDKLIGAAYPTTPQVEPWETWLDELSWPDGFPLILIDDTYYRDDAVDDGWYGDYILEDFSEDPAVWPYPVVISGDEIAIIGPVLDVIPPPFTDGVTIDTTYRSLLTRPKALDKVLPAGCGVLVLDYSLL